VIYIRFWYCHIVRKSLLGSRYCKLSTSSLRERVLLYHARSWRGRPERCVTRSRGVIRSVAKASYILKVGRYVLTGVSQSSFPSSTRMPIDVVVNALVHEPIGNKV